VKDLSDPTVATLEVASALDAAGLPAAVYGGLALAAYGEPRETKDADFAVGAADARAVLEALRRAGIDCAIGFDAVRFGGNDVSRITLLGASTATGLNVLDLVRPRSRRYASAVLERALTGTVRGRRVTIVAPEDFVLLKVLSTRERDVEDAASVLRSLAGRLDHALIDGEASLLAAEVPDHSVTDRLSRARAGAEHRTI